jgi:multicomponent Na+:H+ antiporter subunit A
MIAMIILVGFVLAVIAPWLTKNWRNGTGSILAIFPFFQAAYFIYLLFTQSEKPLQVSLPWSPQIGLQLSFNLDGLGLLFAALISGIGCLITVYASGYLKGNQDLGRFFFWLFVFMTAMIGVVLADNLILLFFFWELTSLSSFFLIGFKHDEQRSRDAALQALLVTGFGGLAMLAGFVILGETSGTYEITGLLSTGNLFNENPLYTPALILILIGAFTKSAQFPFHFWLPNAMEAPTPVSAYLHSATMVKAGIYLMARLLPILGGTPEWQSIVIGIGAITTATGAYLAIGQTDLKRMLAYSTVSALGTMTLLLGMGDILALKAAIAFVFAHALYKGALFMVAGSVDHETGTRDIRILGGLRKTMPGTTLAAILAGLSMAGVLPLFGFIAKEVLYERALEADAWIIAVVVFAAIVNVIVAALVAITPFWRKRVMTHDQPVMKPHEAPITMLAGPLFLAVIGLLAGIFTNVSGNFLSGAVNAAANQIVELKFALWHGFNPAFILSLVTLATGIGFYLLISPIRLFLQNFIHLPGPEKAYQLTWKGILVIATKITAALQSGYLRAYLSIIIITVIGGVSLTLLLKGGWHIPEQILEPRFYEIGLILIILVAALNVTISKSRLSAVASMGAIGFSIALLYLLYGAPDLAMTQFLIESLTVILFVVAFYHLPRFSTLSSKHARVRDIFIALFAGGLMTMLVLSSIGGQVYPPISQYYSENAYLLGHGRNVVNVILVDFRGIDTMGEITVLGIAAIGVFALLRLRLKKEPKEEVK